MARFWTSWTKPRQLLDPVFWERYLGAPEKDLQEILRRQGCVAEFMSRPLLVEKISSIFKVGSDIERILGRLQNRIARPREIGGLRTMLRGLPGLREILLQVEDETSSICSLAREIRTFDPLRELLERALEEELPAEIKVDVKGQVGRLSASAMMRNLINCAKWQRVERDGSLNSRVVKGIRPVFRTLK